MQSKYNTACATAQAPRKDTLYNVKAMKTGDIELVFPCLGDILTEMLLVPECYCLEDSVFIRIGNEIVG